MRLAGIGCGAIGCAGPLLGLFILLGAGGVLLGKWDALAAPDVPTASADAEAIADIPPDFLRLYQEAAARFGIDWPVLAAVGRVETNHGRVAADCQPNYAGARGPMQFLRGTFEFAARLARLQDPDICDPSDAIHAAAAFLEYHGAPKDWERALYRYNPHDAYPRIVLGWAARYGYGALVVWPVEGGRITQGFGPSDFELAPPMCYRGRCYPHFHDGLDIAAPLRTPVVAIATGRVDYAGRVTGGSVIVQVDHEGDVMSLYGHLQPQLRVRDGATVVAGQTVGTIGMTGLTTGPHLHLEVHVGGEPVDPLTVLPPRDR